MLPSAVHPCPLTCEKKAQYKQKNKSTRVSTVLQAILPDFQTVPWVKASSRRDITLIGQEMPLEFGLYSTVLYSAYCTCIDMVHCCSNVKCIDRIFVELTHTSFIITTACRAGRWAMENQSVQILFPAQLRGPVGLWTRRGGPHAPVRSLPRNDWRVC